MPPRKSPASRPQKTTNASPKMTTRRAAKSQPESPSIPISPQTIPKPSVEITPPASNPITIPEPSVETTSSTITDTSVETALTTTLPETTVDTSSASVPEAIVETIPITASLEPSIKTFSDSIDKTAPKVSEKAIAKPATKKIIKVVKKIVKKTPARPISPQTIPKPSVEITPPQSDPNSIPEPTVKTALTTITEAAVETAPTIVPETTVDTSSASIPEATVETTPITASLETSIKTLSHSIDEPAPKVSEKTIAKPATKKTIKVVKKIVKKKIVKRVPKGPDVPSNAEMKNPEPSLDGENPKPPISASIEVECPNKSTIPEAENPVPAAGVLSEIPLPDSFGAQIDEYATETPCAVAETPVEAPNGESVGGQADCLAENPNSASGNDAEENVEDFEADAKGDEVVQDEEMEVSERRRRRKAEIFIGGLHIDAKEEDIRKVFEKIGEVVEVRLMMNNQTKKNKGYAFLRYASVADAKRALTEYPKVEVCGRKCGTAAVEVNDTIYLGNIDKKWKKEDVLKLLQEIGIEKIDTVTVMTDPINAECNRGFAFLELESNKDAHFAYKKLQKKGIFGKDHNISVSWAEPLNEPDEEEMLKVKSVYIEGVPSSWVEEKVREHFKKFGEIERVVLARNIHSSRRKDYAFVNYTTREAAVACIDSLNKEELIDEGSKVHVKVSLAKPISKDKQSKGGSKSNGEDNPKEKPKAIQRDVKVSASFNKGKSARGVYTNSGGSRSFTKHEPVQIPIEQGTWGQPHIGFDRGSSIYNDYPYSFSGGKRPFSALGVDAHYSDMRAHPRARLESSFPVPSSSAMARGIGGMSLPYYQQSSAGYSSGSLYSAAGHSNAAQMRQGGALYGSELYRRY